MAELGPKVGVMEGNNSIKQIRTMTLVRVIVQELTCSRGWYWLQRIRRVSTITGWSCSLEDLTRDCGSITRIYCALEVSATERVHCRMTYRVASPV